jgi:hypothetical protein
MMRQIRSVDPGDLRLPPERPDGPDPFKLADQYREFGDSIEGMPPIWVIEGTGGELLIVDGVTRASRVYLYRRGTAVPVEVIRVTGHDWTSLPRVMDVLP